MDADRFATLPRALADMPSRRTALRLMAGALLGRLLLGAEPSAAKKQRGKGKRKKRKRGGQPSPPLGPVPVPVLTYQCPGPNEDEFIPEFPDNTRVAQSFTAAQSGSLHQIQFEIDHFAGSTGDYVVDLLDFSAEGVPTNTVLATATIPNASVPEGTAVLLTATFSGPRLTAGTEYAAALSRPGATDFQLRIRVGGSDCTGRACSQRPTGINPFGALSDVDLVVSVSVLV